MRALAAIAQLVEQRTCKSLIIKDKIKIFNGFLSSKSAV